MKVEEHTPTDQLSSGDQLRMKTNGSEQSPGFKNTSGNKRIYVATGETRKCT